MVLPPSVTSRSIVLASLERSLVAGPSAPEADLLIDIGTIGIKRLMYQTSNHRLHQSLVLL